MAGRSLSAVAGALLVLSTVANLGAQVLDVDTSGRVEVSTDVVYTARHIVGLTAVPPSFRDGDPEIPEDPTIAAHVDGIGSLLDVDGDGAVNAATDLVYVARHLVGLTPVPASFRVLDPSLPADEIVASNVERLLVLGTRRFSLNPQESAFVFALPGVNAPNAGFQGFLELSAGRPDAQGVVMLDITDASEVISLDLNPDAPFTVCLRPLSLPVRQAGVVDCAGLRGVSVEATQDHRAGVVGENGFGADDCAAMGGRVEGETEPHPGVCNGPLSTAPASGPASRGGAQIGLDTAGEFGGLPVEISFEQALPCGDEPDAPPVATTLGLTTGLSRASITDLDNDPGASFVHDETGIAFDCRRWAQEDGPGRLVLSLPTLHGLAGTDMVSVFRFTD